MGLLGLALLALALLLAGGLAGYLTNVWLARRAEKERRRIPKQWPLDPRSMANSDECRVWRWLIRVFFDHYVMIKVPVTRFTFPRIPRAARGASDGRDLGRPRRGGQRVVRRGQGPRHRPSARLERASGARARTW